MSAGVGAANGGNGGATSHDKMIKPPLTVSAGVGAANGGNWCAAGHNKLIKLAFILLVFRLCQHHILNVQPGRKGERQGRKYRIRTRELLRNLGNEYRK